MSTPSLPDGWVEFLTINLDQNGAHLRCAFRAVDVNQVYERNKTTCTIETHIGDYIVAHSWSEVWAKLARAGLS